MKRRKQIDKYRKKFHCDKCTFCVDSLESMERHKKEYHGIFPKSRHKRSKSGKELKKKDNKKTKILITEAHGFRCCNCEGAAVIHRNLRRDISNLILCPVCGLNLLEDNSHRLSNYLYNHPDFEVPKGINLSLVLSPMIQRKLERKEIKLKRGKLL